ncbi:MAG TPA: capsule assembly Wzi family protein, partial [Longimicrobiaceae bacterium]|nr:capsule assembly Wzi family protein [Longimicrobiaceae bacterium]
LLGSAAGAGYERRGGAAEPGAGLFGRRTGVTPLPLRSTAVAEARLAGALAPGLAAAAEPRLADGGLELPRWDVVAGWGPVALSLGEQPVGYGPAAGGGVVLSGAAALPRLEAQTSRPLALPGWLRLLGPVSAHTFVTRLDERRHPGDPYLWGMRVALRPHPRLTVGMNRASIFGGDSVSTRVTAGSVGRMLLGMLSDDFENQVVAAEFRYRLPTEEVLPLTLYLEWGADDGAGAWWDVPGRVLGAYVPAVPGAEALALGAEYTSFATLCCGNPGWYTHAAQPGGWAAEGALLGHPLGGEGRELLVYSHADLAGARLRLDGRVFRRERGREGYDAFPRAGNLFAPERAGPSTGLHAGALWRATRRAELRLGAYREVGDGWRAHELDLNASLLF